MDDQIYIPKILVVEDEEGIRKILNIMLTREGYSVLEAKDGSEAKEILSGGTEFDVVLLDIKMPKIDGIQLLSWIKKEQLVTTVIMLSSLQEEDMAASTQALGAFGYLTKPIRKEALVAVIEKGIANTQSLQIPVFR